MHVVRTISILHYITLSLHDITVQCSAVQYRAGQYSDTYIRAYIHYIDCINYVALRNVT